MNRRSLLEIGLGLLVGEPVHRIYSFLRVTTVQKILAQPFVPAGSRDGQILMVRDHRLQWVDVSELHL
jgi:hypothetical protein